MAKGKQVLQVVTQPTNDWEKMLAQTAPFTVAVTVRGVAALMFNRWSVEVVKGTVAAGKGVKLEGDPELLVYRDADGGLCVPSEHFRMAMVKAGRFFKSPQNPRASLMELLKAGVFVTPELIPLGTDRWDYLDTRRCGINRGAINKTRPAMQAGWEVSFEVENVVAEYISPPLLQDVIVKAGRFCGVGDFRPTHGRFQVVNFEIARPD